MNTKHLLMLAGGGAIFTVASLWGLTFAGRTTSIMDTSVSWSPTWTYAMMDGKGKWMHAMMRGWGMIYDDMPGMWGKMKGMYDSALQAAITANDYDAFVKAWSSMQQGRSQKKVPSAEQFAQMVAKQKQHDAMEAAVVANDYDAFVKASTPTKEQFAHRVATYQHRQAIESALKANDYNAFLTAWETTTMKPTDKPAPSVEQFARMVERFVERE